MNAVFGKDGCGTTSTDHDVGNGSVVDALGVDDLEVSTSGRGRGDDNPIGVRRYQESNRCGELVVLGERHWNTSHSHVRGWLHVVEGLRSR